MELKNPGFPEIVVSDPQYFHNKYLLLEWIDEELNITSLLYLKRNWEKMEKLIQAG